jgi:hypothetical protein
MREDVMFLMCSNGKEHLIMHKEQMQRTNITKFIMHDKLKGGPHENIVNK